MNAFQTYSKTSLAFSISAEGLHFLKWEEDINPFAKNICESCDLHNRYNTSTTISVYENLKTLGLLYIMIQEEEIKNHLIKNTELISTLLEAQVQIEARFGSAPLYLELHTDFENPEWTKLFLIIKNNLPNNLAMEKLENLFKSWFFLKDKKVRKYLTISEEFL